MYAIDHVITVVDDLDSAAARLFETYGLGSLPGGRHPGHGTGNRIVPLSDGYLEMMAVVDPDEAATSPMGRWAAHHADPALGIAAVCIRADDITEPATTLGETPLAMSRLTPGGATLSWHLVGLDGMFAHGWPFFIQWDTADLPGTAHAEHRVEPIGFGAVSVPTVPEAIGELLAGLPGLSIGGTRRTARIETAAGPIDL